ncbi:hypothetical protein Bbelb_353840 [Branchiostoma belcheri]|nr:hypothetical protein Bbelb_353840 [Branchiostoma belcheri]
MREELLGVKVCPNRRPHLATMPLVWRGVITPRLCITTTGAQVISPLRASAEDDKETIMPCLIMSGNHAKPARSVHRLLGLSAVHATPASLGAHRPAVNTAARSSPANSARLEEVNLGTYHLQTHLCLANTASPYPNS